MCAVSHSRTTLVRPFRGRFSTFTITSQPLLMLMTCLNTRWCTKLPLHLNLSTVVELLPPSSLCANEGGEKISGVLGRPVEGANLVPCRRRTINTRKASSVFISWAICLPLSNSAALKWKGAF